MAHISFEKHEEKKIIPNKEDVHLRDIVEKNFKKEIYSGPKTPTDLINNFNWVIMRKRRSLKISKEKVAEDIFEPLIAVESLEKGILPRDYQSVIKKIEGYLQINLRKDKWDFDHKDIINESKVPTGILISEIKKKVEEKKDEYIDISNLNLEKVNEIYGTPETLPRKDAQKGNSKKDISDEDVSKLVWGK